MGHIFGNHNLLKVIEEFDFEVAKDFDDKNGLTWEKVNNIYEWRKNYRYIKIKEFEVFVDDDSGDLIFDIGYIEYQKNLLVVEIDSSIHNSPGIEMKRTVFLHCRHYETDELNSNLTEEFKKECIRTTFRQILKIIEEMKGNKSNG